MSYIENFKIQHKADRRKDVFWETHTILTTECNASKKSFWHAQFYNYPISKNSYWYDMDKIIKSFNQNFDLYNEHDLDDENTLKSQFLLLLEVSLIYCAMPNKSASKIRCGFSCTCNTIRNDLRENIKILLNGNDEIIFGAKIKIEKKEGQPYPTFT